MDTNQRLARLRDYYLGVRPAYPQLAEDIGLALDRAGSLQCLVDLGADLARNVGCPSHKDRTYWQNVDNSLGRFRAALQDSGNPAYLIVAR